MLGSIAGGTGALLSYWAGWRARGAQRPPRGSYGLPATRRRNPFVSEFQEQINDQLGIAEGLVQQGSGTTLPPPPKPQPSGGRLIGPNGAPVGYRPSPSRPGANPPLRKP
jgi:hypothetical protein